VRSLAEIAGLRTGPCREAAPAIPQIAAGDARVSPTATDHVNQCLRCQAEVAAFRRVLRIMRSIREEPVQPPPGALAALLAALDEAAASRHPAGVAGRTGRAAYVGGITVVTAAAGAAGVLVWMNRRRPGWARTG